MVETIDGSEIYYESAGEGDAVLLLHGWGCSTETMAPLAGRLSAYGRVVSLDFPGHGRSTTPEKPIHMDDFARITKEFMERQGLVGCDVIGHSFGGRVILKLAKQNVFRKVVITGGAGIRPKRSFAYYRRIYTFKLLKRIGMFPPIRAFLFTFGIDVRERIKNAGSADYRALPDAMKGTFSNVVNEDLSPCLQALRSPTLLVWGTDDTETPLWMAEQMEREMPDAGLVKFEGAGHYAFLERFEDFLVIVRHFFTGGNA